MLWTRKPSPMAARRRLHFLAPTLLELKRRILRELDEAAAD